MRKVVKVKNIDCASCTSKIEREVGQIDGVESASMNFMTQRLTINADENSMSEIINKAEKIVHKIEPDAEFLA